MSTVIEIGNKAFHVGLGLNGTNTQGLIIDSYQNSVHATILGDFKPTSIVGQEDNVVAVKLESATAHGGFDLYLLSRKDNIISNQENVLPIEQEGHTVTRFYRSRNSETKPHPTLGVIGDFALFTTERKSTILKPLVGDIYDAVMSMVDIDTSSSERNVFLYDNVLHG